MRLAKKISKLAARTIDNRRRACSNIKKKGRHGQREIAVRAYHPRREYDCLLAEGAIMS